MRDVRTSKYPVFLCEQINSDPPTQRFWCSFCVAHHVHGMGPGHRIAHCSTEAGLAAFPNGYVLKVKEEPGG
jgi:hypothetical protein